MRSAKSALRLKLDCAGYADHAVVGPFGRARLPPSPVPGLGGSLALPNGDSTDHAHGLPSLGKAAYAESMHVTLHYGHTHLECEVRDGSLVGVQQATP